MFSYSESPHMENQLHCRVTPERNGQRRRDLLPYRDSEENEKGFRSILGESVRVPSPSVGPIPRIENESLREGFAWGILLPSRGMR